jgi:hypothetical protein
MAKTDWVKLTIRIKPETHYMLNKLCPAEPAVVIRGMIERYVGKLIEAKNKEDDYRKLEELDGNSGRPSE